MKIVLIAFTCTAAAAVVAYAGQNSSSQSQSNTTQRSSSGQERPVTLTGCVYQASDQPQVFALQRMSANSTTGTSGTTDKSGHQSTSSSAQGTSGTQSSQNAQQGTTGTRRTGWFRLTNTGAQRMSQYVGQPVRVNGTMVRSTDENGGEIVIHDVGPNQVTITSVDLTPAPELKISSISPTQGTCNQQSGTSGNSGNGNSGNSGNSGNNGKR